MAKAKQQVQLWELIFDTLGKSKGKTSKEKYEESAKVLEPVFKKSGATKHLIPKDKQGNPKKLTGSKLQTIYKWSLVQGIYEYGYSTFDLGKLMLDSPNGRVTLSMKENATVKSGREIGKTLPLPSPQQFDNKFKKALGTVALRDGRSLWELVSVYYDTVGVFTNAEKISLQMEKGKGMGKFDNIIRIMDKELEKLGKTNAQGKPLTVNYGQSVEKAIKSIGFTNAQIGNKDFRNKNSAVYKANRNNNFEKVARQERSARRG